jgi:hypothetical protein
MDLMSRMGLTRVPIFNAKRVESNRQDPCVRMIRRLSSERLALLRKMRTVQSMEKMRDATRASRIEFSTSSRLLY